VATTITSWTGNIKTLKKLKVRFAKPVYPEDVITIKGCVTEIKENRVLLSIEAVNQRGEKVISHGSGVVELPSLKKS